MSVDVREEALRQIQALSLPSSQNGAGLVPRELKVFDGGDFILDTPKEIPAVVGEGQDVAIAKGEATVIAGNTGSGKTTIGRALVLARIEVAPPEWLGMPAEVTGQPVLYLALDRPRQIARNFRRGLDDTSTTRALMNERLKFTTDKPDISDPDCFLKAAAAAKADMMFVDSLKDLHGKLSDEAVGHDINTAYQRAEAEGVTVILDHHQRKASGDNKKPKTISDVYGSSQITNGAGSVLLVWTDEPGARVAEFRSLKPIAESIGPYKLIYDHEVGSVTLGAQPTVLSILRGLGGSGDTPLIAGLLFEVAKPTDAQIERARTRLRKEVNQGHLTEHPGTNKTPTRWTVT